MSKKKTNDELIELAMSLRDRGYAVIIWSPSELKDAPGRKVEDRSIELGWDIIEDLQEAGAE